jgi:hypothetical protein
MAIRCLWHLSFYERSILENSRRIVQLVSGPSASPVQPTLADAELLTKEFRVDAPAQQMGSEHVKPHVKLSSM